VDLNVHETARPLNIKIAHPGSALMEEGRVDTWGKGRGALERNHMENKCCGLHAEDSVRDERVVVVSVQSCESVVDITMLGLISTHSFYHVA